MRPVSPMMSPKQEFPPFEEKFPEVDQFLLHLQEEFNGGKIQSWDVMDEKVKSFFADGRTKQIETKVPGWKEMASYAGGLTQTHILCAMLGLYMMPEFHALPAEQRQIAKWIVFLHDTGKIMLNGRGDYFHPFRSGIIAAKALPKLGFVIKDHYNSLIDQWIEFVGSSKYPHPTKVSEHIHDSSRIEEIYTGIHDMFGRDSPAALIIKGVLLHQSIDTVKEWPQTAPLTEEQIRQYVDVSLYPLLRVMHLSDNEGWSMFEPETRALQRKETLEAFANIEALIQDEAI